MNLEYFYEQQEKLDKHIAESKGVEHRFIETRIKKYIAFKQEFGELLQRLPATFKYWSNKENVLDDETLEEWVDGFHFLLSIGIADGKELKEVNFEEGYSNDDLYLLIDDVYSLSVWRYYDKVFRIYYTLIIMLGYTDEQIKKAYQKKCKINHERQKAGY